MPKIAAVILAGGKARRLNGQNKCDVMIGHKSCLDWTLEHFQEHVCQTAMSVGRKDRYGHSKSHEIIFDWPTDAQNPSVAYAILGSLDWAKTKGLDGIITTPVDTPFLPKSFTADLIDRFDANAPIVCKTASGLQGLHALWPVQCFDPIKRFILKDSIYKISTLHRSLSSVELSLPNSGKHDFTNINTEEDLESARSHWTQSEG